MKIEVCADCLKDDIHKEHLSTKLCCKLKRIMFSGDNLFIRLSPSSTAYIQYPYTTRSLYINVVNIPNRKQNRAYHYGTETLTLH